MLRSLNLLLSFVMKSPAAENALSASTDVGGTEFMASYSFVTFFVRSLVVSKIASSFVKCL